MIIGITGTDGAGKGTVVEYLIQKGFTHYSARAFILAAIELQGLPQTRNQMRLTANQLRKEHGNEYVIKQALQKAHEEQKDNVVIESVRALAEAEYLISKGGVLLAVDADQALRFERVQARRSETDQVSLEEFVAHEELERNDPDKHGMQKAAVMEMAHTTLLNNGSYEELREQVEAFLTSVTP